MNDPLPMSMSDEAFEKLLKGLLAHITDRLNSIEARLDAYSLRIRILERDSDA